MNRTVTRMAAAGVGLLLGAAGIALARWKRKRLADLAAGSDLLTTDRGVVEVARRGSGYPVLVLHGDPGGYDQGLHLGSELFGSDVELIAPSRPGYLRTPLDGNESFEDQAALLVALLDELDVEQALVVGLSGGGPTALQLAADYPDRVSGVVLVSAVTNDLDERLFDIDNPFVDPLLTSTPVLDVRSGLFVALGRFAPDTLVAMLHDEVSALEGAALAAYVESIVTNPRYLEQSLDFVPTMLPVSARIDGTLNDERLFRALPNVAYGTIECPTLVLHGKFDESVPFDHAEFVVDALPNVELVGLDADHLVWIGSGHERAREAVQAFTELVTASGEPMTS
ncbi:MULTISPECIES: alpha/beta fold hydrolase [Haloferax]|uniref:Alpha/beta fold hydrolase n=2 Tax=Haloferax TaxID=2251 RepID=A0A6G1Z0G3_9EURY|nr:MULTISPECIES: alpha/beta hydrolase [Haloferax]KAB1187429.1 alpha/beta hydrolase [Haloferax sp. CBA1149]MRW80079.1 alpha/beta fold hydrolase [Haloferax marinisediminis]